MHFVCTKSSCRLPHSKDYLMVVMKPRPFVTVDHSKRTKKKSVCMKFERKTKRNFNNYDWTGTSERVSNGFAFGQRIKTIQRFQSLDYFIVHTSNIFCFFVASFIFLHFMFLNGISEKKRKNTQPMDFIGLFIVQ